MILKKSLTIAVLSAVAGQAYALEPASFGSGGFAFTPTVNFAITDDDNIRATQDAQSSKVTSVTPNFAVSMASDKTTFDAAYSLNHRVYEKESVDSLTDHNLSASSSFLFDSRNRLKLTAGYSRTERIANATVVGKTDKLNDFKFGGVYVYGAPSATGNLELGFNLDRLRAEDDINDDLERNSNAVSALFSVKGAGTSRLLAEVIAAQHDYQSADIKDSNNYTGRVGVRWEATAKTTGELKAGYERKEFDDSSIDDADLVNWAASLSWQPRTYSTFTLSSSQRIDEGNYGATSADARDVTLSWAHDWGNRIKSSINAGVSNKDYSTGREDDANNYGIKVDYQMRRWMDIGIGYQYSEQDSTDLDYDYDRRKVFADLTVSF